MRLHCHPWLIPVLLAAALGSCQKGDTGSALLLAPTDLIAEVVAVDQVQLQWREVPDATGYNVYSSTSETGTYTRINSDALTSPGHSLTGLAPDTTYWLKVAAVKGKKEQTLSAAVSVSTISLWARVYKPGPDNGSIATALEPAANGGYIVAGHSEIYRDEGGEAGVSSETGDAWILKINLAGAVSWQKTYGGPKADMAAAVRQTPDGGYVVAGSTDSFGAGKTDIWVLRLDSTGGVIWQNAYGGSGYEKASAIESASGGYVVAGSTTSFGRGGSDLWVIRLTPEGDVEWQKAYGGRRDDEASCIRQTSDGGYVVAGSTSSLSLPDGDAWVLKLAGDGEVVWQNAYGGSDYDGVSDIRQTSDGGYLVAAWTYSLGHGREDVWVLKLDAEGGVAWERQYGGEGDDGPLSMDLTADGGCVLVCNWVPDSGAQTAWVLKLAADGEVNWQASYSARNEAAVIRQARDGTSVLAGPTRMPGQHIWVMRLDREGQFFGRGGKGPSSSPARASSDVTRTEVTPSVTNAAAQRTEVTGVDTSAVPESFEP